MEECEANVRSYDKEIFNTNNHGIRPDDYYQSCDSGHTGLWVDHFHTKGLHWYVDALVNFLNKSSDSPMLRIINTVSPFSARFTSYATTVNKSFLSRTWEIPRRHYDWLFKVM